MSHTGTTRLSISLPTALAKKLDSLVETRGFGSRSQAVSEMIHLQLIGESAERGEDVMTGTITLCYRHSQPRLKQTLAEIQYRHVDAVISSFHVYLKQQQTLEVILVQGPADRLRTICNEMTALKGVILGKLQFASATLPPIYEHR